jgi:beta-glucosidase
VKVNVTNTGTMKGDEVVQLYLTDEKASTPRPIVQLEGFNRVYLQPGQTKTVEFDLIPRQFSMIDKNEERVIEPGEFTVYVGGGQPGKKSAVTVSGKIRLTGDKVNIK